MKDTTGFVYDDLRVIGGNPGNANQDGMDWIGSADDALVRECVSSRVGRRYRD